MENIKNWYTYNQSRITWFIIGLLFTSGLYSLAEERYMMAAVNFGLAYFNYYLDRRDV
jgi:hypothetical protein